MSVRMLLVGCLGLFIPAIALGQGAPATLPSPAPGAAPAAAPAEAAPVTPAAEAVPAPLPAPEPALMAAPTQPEPLTPVIAEAPAAEPAPETTPPAAPPKMAVGTEGLFQPGLLLQAWFMVDSAEETTSTFRLRRAEFSAKGDIIPGSLSYALMFDPARVLEPRDAVLPVANQDPAASDATMPETVTAKQSSGPISILKDVYLTFQSEYVDASIGQFKTPLSWEGYNSSSKLLFAERAMISNDYGDKRDMGLRLAKTFEYFGYSAGLFNGTGSNNLDTDNAKDGALRFEGYPVKDMVLAGVVYATLWDRAKAGSKDRWELDARYDLGAVLIQAEFLRARDKVPTKTAVDAQGFYAAVAVRLLDKKLEPALRVGYYDPNTDIDVDPAAAKGKDEAWHVEGGLTYYIQKQEARVQLNYGHFAYDTKKANNEVTLATQFSF